MPLNDLNAIKKRITAATQTSKITRTMELIASSRLQRGKLLLAGYQDWFQHMREASKCLPDSCFAPPDYEPGGGRRVYIVFAGSKGLSGAYTPNLMQYAKPIVSGHFVLAVGSAGDDYFPDARSFFPEEIPSPDNAGAIVRAAKTIYEDMSRDESDDNGASEVCMVYMVYTRGSKQVTEQLFPLVRREQYDADVIVEPSARLLFPVLLDEYAEAIVYEAHLQAFISEQVARVSAMDSATRNADDIIASLQADYNRIRQTSITQEIITVSNAARGGD